MPGVEIDPGPRVEAVAKSGISPAPSPQTLRGVTSFFHACP